MRISTAFGLGLSLLLCSSQASADVTVYGQIPLAMTRSVSGSAPAPSQTTGPYDNTVLTPPPVPSGLNQFPKIQLQTQASALQGLSIPHTRGSFFGFSIEMSVISQLMGKNSTFIQVPFLNLVANIQDRAGYVYARLGGNTQEDASLVFENLDSYRNTEKSNQFNKAATTLTPVMLYTLDLFYAAANISQLVNIEWFLGIPFNQTSPWRLDIVEYGEMILGDRLAGLQAGNEPDFYSENGRRPGGYTPQDYSNDIGNLIQTIQGNSNIPVKNNLIGPSAASITWGPNDVWNTGFIQNYGSNFFAFSVEHYPDNNCAAQFGGTDIVNPQTVFPNYLTHQSGVNLCNPYLESTGLSQQANKPFIMFETNTASCGGFPGVSDSFGAALWAVDYGLQMAYSNFSNALLHFGGQNSYYNAFTPPPTNQSTFHQWTAGSIYYSILVVAEALGKTNTSQVMDLTGPNQLSEFTPAYAIYENGQLTKAALFNYVDDVGGTTGQGSLNVSLALPAGSTPQSVSVKYLSAPSVSSKSDNMTWANQTLGGRFQVDGILRGTLDVQPINCDTTNNVCTIPIPSPGFALVFFNNGDEMLKVGQATETFATTAHTKTANTASIDPTVLATSNGSSGKDRKIGSTSKGSVNSAGRVRGEVWVSLVLGAVVWGAWVVLGSK